MPTHKFLMTVEADDDDENADDAEWWADAAAGAIGEYGGTASFELLGASAPCADFRFILVASPKKAPDGWAFCDDPDVIRHVTIAAPDEATAREAAATMAPAGYSIVGVTLAWTSDDPTT